MLKGRFWRRFARSCAGLAGLAALMLAPDSRGSLSLQTFENPPPTGLPLAYWSVVGGSPLIYNNSDAASGERSLVVPAPSGATATEVNLVTVLLGDDPGFCDLWIKPVARTLALTASGQPVETTGVLYVDGAHFLFSRVANRYSLYARTLDGADQPSWTRLGGFAGTPADYEIEDSGGRAKDWLRLTIRRDLEAGTYDVWINARLVAVDLVLDRLFGAPEFRLSHRPTDTPGDGPLSPMLLDDVQASPNHPLYADTDRDALPDIWESAYEKRLEEVDVITPDRYSDADSDGVLKIVEYAAGSRPNHADSDLDGIPDAVEIEHGLNPASKLDAALDKDGDGFSNLAEYQDQGNAEISLPPAGPLTNVVYVKADHQGVQNGEYATPFVSIRAALLSPSLTENGRIVVRGEGGAVLETGFSSPPTIARRITLVGVNMAQIGPRSDRAFASIAIPATSAPSGTTAFVCENILFHGWAGVDGGAFSITGTPGDVVFRNCRFTNCTAQDDGGALFAQGGKLTLEDCWFNSCSGNLGEGGAVHAEGNAIVTIRRCHFQGNVSATDGGGLSLRGATDTAAVVENCVFQSNGAQRGGAVAAVDGADVNVTQCTLSANTASLSGMAGGIYAATTASLVVAKGCILWGNTANGSTTPHFSGGTRVVGYCSLSGWTSTLGPTGTGNNASDPVFRTGTLIPSSSAMLDSSDPAFNTLSDFLNNPRWDAPGGTAGTTADRGAFEKQADSDSDGMSDDWEARYALNTLDATDAEADADQDGYSNFEEFGHKTDPRNSASLNAPVVFVNPGSGFDWHPGPNPPTGTISTSLQGNKDNPFKSIRRAILACANGRRIVLMDGNYAGVANLDLKRSESWTWTPHLAAATLTSTLSLDTKTIRGLNGPGRVTLDGGGTNRLFDLNLYSGSVAATVKIHNVSMRRGYSGASTGGLGGAIRVTGSAGYGTLELRNCVLSGNSATTAGGAIHATGSGMNLQFCTFSANDAPTGGAVALLNLSPTGTSNTSYATLNGCRFAYNLAQTITATDGVGGALSSQASYFSTTSTTFDRNNAGRHGGAIAVLSHSNYYPPSISTGTRFLTNTCANRGGAVYVTNAALMISGSHFEDNIAGTTSSTGEGGALFLGHPALGTVTSASYSSRAHEISATRFSRNLAGSRGGAVALSDVSPVLTNDAFTENRSTGSTAQGGAISVAWEVPSSGNPLVPNHTPAPKIVHGTFARNQGNEGANVLAQLLTTPWFINSLFSDGWSPRPTPSLIGPRHLWGSQIAPPDALVAPTETDSTRRNVVDGIAQTTAPVLAFDWFHLASPVRIPVPTDSSTDTGGVEPSGSVSFIRPSADIDNEARPAFVANKFTLMRGCDEPRDGESPADGLPDWFEKLGYEYSPYDALTALSHIASGGTTLQLATVSPTNNPDADSYTISQELLNGGRPDLPESEFIGRDSDGDGLSDVYERTSLLGLEWQNPDQNADGVADGWSIRHFGVLTVDLEADADGDGISNGSEANLGLNPTSFDSDGDGVPDLWEILAGTNPLDIDSNHDGSPDVWGAFPPNGAVSLPGLHLPSAAEPWYLERAWSAFDFDPGSYFREWEPPSGSWGLDTMASYSDSLRQLGLLTPSLVVSDAFRERLNSMDDHDQFRPSASVNRSLSAIKDHHMSLHQPVFYPQDVEFAAPDEAIFELLGNRQSTEAWTSQWFATVKAWIGSGPGARTAENIHGSTVIGAATQRWNRFNGEPQNIETEATRLVQTIRLRCPIPGGAPQAVTQSYLRIRGHAARVEQYPSSTPTATHPADENNFTITPVTLTLAKGAQVGPEITLDPHEPTLRATTNPTLPATAPSTNSALNYFELVQFDCLLPVELSTDTDNNGQIDGSDMSAAQVAYKPGATAAEIDRATEFIFANDSLSNGAWDKDDTTTPGMPASAVDDDDAEEIQIQLTGLPDASEVWLDHPAIAGLAFYTSRKCLPADKVNLSPSQHYITSSNNPISKLKKLYVRAEGTITFPTDDPQVEGELKLMLKPSSTATAIEAVTMKFTVVRELRAKKYFQAVRDYILENNTPLRVDDKKFPEGSTNPTTTIRMCLMREEATKMVPFESYWDDAYQGFLASNPPAGTPFEPELYTSYGFGIDGALAADPSMTIIINGNQCDLTDPSLPTEAVERRNTLSGLALLGVTNLSDRCHGRVIINGRKSQSSSDLDDPNLYAAGTSYRGSYLAGEDPAAGSLQAGGKYVAQYADGHFEIERGRVPWLGVPGTVPTIPLPSNAIGGLSGYYSDPKRDDFPNSFVGLASHLEIGKGVVFVAMGKAKQNTILGVKYTSSDGNGRVREFYEAAKASGVPKIVGATPAGTDDVIQLVMLDSGDTSCALTHVTPAGTHQMVFKGTKHEGLPYYTNTFLRFKAQKPRESNGQ